MRGLNEIKCDNLLVAHRATIERARTRGKTQQGVIAILQQGGLAARPVGDRGDVEVYAENTYLTTLHGSLESALDDLWGG